MRYPNYSRVKAICEEIEKLHEIREDLLDEATEIRVVGEGGKWLFRIDLAKDGEDFEEPSKNYLGELIDGYAARIQTLTEELKEL